MVGRGGEGGGGGAGRARQVAMVVAKVSTHHYCACHAYIQGNVEYLIYMRRPGAGPGAILELDQTW